MVRYFFDRISSNAHFSLFVIACCSVSISGEEVFIWGILLLLLLRWMDVDGGGEVDAVFVVVLRFR